MRTAFVGQSAHPPGSESLTVSYESMKKKVRTREKQAEPEPCSSISDLDPQPQHILPPHGAPPHAVTHAHLAHLLPVASSDTHFPLLGGAEQVTGENNLQGFLSRVFTHLPDPHPSLVPVPVGPTCPQPLTSMAPGVSDPVQVGGQDAGSGFELCDSGRAPSPL